MWWKMLITRIDMVSIKVSNVRSDLGIYPKYFKSMAIVEWSIGPNSGIKLVIANIKPKTYTFTNNSYLNSNNEIGPDDPEALGLLGTHFPSSQ